MARTLSHTRKELLENTSKRYNKNNRAINCLGGCDYILFKDNCELRCAIGIEVNKPLALELNDIAENVNSLEVFDALPMRLRNMGKEFLYAIQRLHDVDSNWTNEGLSLQGKLKAKSIEREFIN